MEMLKQVIDEMWDELHDAKKYVKIAMKHKGQNQMAFDRYMEMSADEINHFNKLHDMATRLIDIEREKGVELTEEEKIIYNYEHEKAIEKANEIKMMQEMARK